MKKRNTVIIFAAVIATAFSLTSCAGREYYTNGNEPVSQTPVTVSSTPAVTESSVEPSVQDSSEDIFEPEISEPESSIEESSEEEISEPESSVEESSEEEISEPESSVEDSSEEVQGIHITFVKPEEWSDNIHVAVYPKGGIAELPGAAMTDNGDGTFSYVITEEVENPVVIFNDADDARHRNMYPRSGSLDVEDGKTYEAVVG